MTQLTVENTSASVTIEEVNFTLELSDVPVVLEMGGTILASSSGAVESVTAAEAISASRVVTASGLYAQPVTYGVIMGITTASAGVGLQAFVATSGMVTEASWSWTPLSPVFAAPDGLLTQTPATTGFLRQIGTAISPTTILIDLYDLYNLG